MADCGDETCGHLRNDISYIQVSKGVDIGKATLTALRSQHPAAEGEIETYNTALLDQIVCDNMIWMNGTCHLVNRGYKKGRDYRYGA